jgi:glutamine synthetase
MENESLSLNPNQIVKHLKKPSREFTKADLTRFIQEKNIQMLNFRYPGGDGRLKSLNFVLTSARQLDRLLSAGERVDGSSLFSYIEASSSDLYVVPRFRTAYVNPFTDIPTVDILCSFYNAEGKPFASAPEQILRSAHESLTAVTGMSMEAMGELEYYAFYDLQSLYPGSVRKGYHESSPFTRGEALRIQAMQAIARAGGTIKYGHSEVGYIAGKEICMEQHEIEFLPVPLEDAADQILIAKWMLRKVASLQGVTVSFAPKIASGHAGSGLHIHTRLMKSGKNMMLEGSELSDTARKVIAGYLTLAPSITAFGNTVPVSYLRLVPHQEAPTNICWGDRNRSTLVRVPLGWRHASDMVKDANPLEAESFSTDSESQTVEFRGADGSADIYLTMAGLAVAARHGFDMKDPLGFARALYVDVNIFDPRHAGVQEKLPHLPTSCVESAEQLDRQRQVYEEMEVFTPLVIDETVKRLQSFNDRGLSEDLYGKDADIRTLVERYIHCS